MVLIDWIILVLYIAFIIGISYLIGRRQHDQDDYYLGGRKVPSWQVGTSMAANQVSAISLVGAPAFIAARENGGLIWLQYELAVPLAMIGIMTLLVPLLRQNTGVTIYRFLETRFGMATRLSLSFIFLVSRSLATGVALLATSYVTSVCIGVPLNETIVLIGVISLVYTSLGGIMADIYSDIIQLAVLWISSIAVIVILYNLLDGSVTFPAGAAPRLQVFDLDSTGLGDEKSFGFWPMLLGGFFLYVSYYGCDQSQAQRLLATRDNRGASRSLLVNGIIRFPVVLTYCAVGLLLIPFLHGNPEFSAKLAGKPPDYVIPYFFNDYVPPGLLGLMVAGIFAASMSSLDSAINSLSAATWDDFLVRGLPSLETIPNLRKVLYSRIITVAWGGLTTGAALYMAGGAETVIELVNKIGSAFYGPIAGVFLLGVMSRRAGQRAALAGLAAGVTVNLLLWLKFTSVSWLWWNLFGFGATMAAGLLAAVFQEKHKTRVMEGARGAIAGNFPARYVFILTGWFFVIVCCSAVIEYLLG